MAANQNRAAWLFLNEQREAEFGRHAIARLINVIRTCIRLAINRWDLARKYDAIRSENNALINAQTSIVHAHTIITLTASLVLNQYHLPHHRPMSYFN